MSDSGLSIAASGLEADRSAMDAIANNLSNVNTPGYAAESANLTTSASYDALGVGSGVTVLNIGQASDAMLSADALSASASSAGSSALQQVLTTVQNVFPEPGSNGISAQLATFWSSWDAVASNPSETAPRTEVINQAQNIASALNQASAELTQTASTTTSQVSSNISEVNTLLTQVAALNQSIVTSQASGATPNALIDQQNSIIQQLGQDIGVTTRSQPNGSTNVYVGGVQLVQGDSADSLSVASSGTPATLSIVSNVSGATVPMSSGTVAGLMRAVNVDIPAYQQQLDSVATALATTVNTQLGKGYDASGNTDVGAGSGVGPDNSAPLFVIGSGPGAAATIGVNAALVANPQLLAAASASSNGANDGSNAQAMAELGTSPGGPDQTYNTFITTLGSQVQTVTSQSQSQQALSQSLQSSLGSVIGVNTDQQTVDMLGYQQAYQASAKVISTIDTMVQSLLSAT